MKLAAAEQRIKELSGQSLSPDEVPGFYTIEKVKEKQSTTSKAKRITQVYVSLKGTEILAKVRELETIKQMKLEEKVKRNEKKEFAISSYFRCKIVCNCTKIAD